MQVVFLEVLLLAPLLASRQNNLGGVNGELVTLEGSKA